MREIKFRVYIKKTKEMLPVVSIVQMNDEEWLRVFPKWYDRNFLGSEWGIVLMQYTWLKDKNGKEIYEGDLVEYCIEWGYWNNDYTIKRTVEYKEWHYNPFIHWHEEFTQKTYPECCEVIGNIYENPELVTI